MDQYAEALHSQYRKSLTMLSDTIGRYDDGLWLDAAAYDSPVWQIVYHTLFYANAYCSPLRDAIRPWSKERENLHRFAGTSSALPRRTILSRPYSRRDMSDFLEFVLENVPNYLGEMVPHERCWPPWYDETQFELQLTNLRHIQHHTAQAIERHDIVNTFDYEWY